MPNRRAKRVAGYPQVSVTVTPQDDDPTAITAFGGRRLHVEIPKEVFPVVEKMCQQRNAGSLAITVTIAGYVR